jgi:hypothetical protein
VVFASLGCQLLVVNKTAFFFWHENVIDILQQGCIANTEFLLQLKKFCVPPVLVEGLPLLVEVFFAISIVVSHKHWDGTSHEDTAAHWSSHQSSAMQCELLALLISLVGYLTRMPLI